MNGLPDIVAELRGELLGDEHVGSGALLRNAALGAVHPVFVLADAGWVGGAGGWEGFRAGFGAGGDADDVVEPAG